MVFSVIQWWLMPRKSLLPTAPATSGATCLACPGKETPAASCRPQLKFLGFVLEMWNVFSVCHPADLWRLWPTTGWTSKDAWSTVAQPRYVCVFVHECVEVHECFLFCVCGCGLTSFHPFFTQMFSSFTLLFSSFFGFQKKSSTFHSEAVCSFFSFRKKRVAVELKKVVCVCFVCVCVCLVLDAYSSLRSCVR